MTAEDRQEFLKVLHAHAHTIAICEACAATTRDLATEVARGGIPPRADLVQTVGEAAGNITVGVTRTPSDGNPASAGSVSRVMKSVPCFSGRRKLPV